MEGGQFGLQRWRKMQALIAKPEAARGRRSRAGVDAARDKRSGGFGLRQGAASEARIRCGLSRETRDCREFCGEEVQGG
ncbi:hypothetical protein HPP92_008990 [Vanilla planifolia]|uniref:Uncharacterized protein n=1 Tax=Vanilla planifolia TaxID=51239 RepID=A0A835R3F9_VANPL|nr:hypothetical protein HPP92_008990 [Vanilla planifolia]